MSDDDAEIEERQALPSPYARGGFLRGILAWIGSCIVVAFGSLALTLPPDSWRRVARSTADYALQAMIAGAPIVLVTVVLIRLLNLPRPWTEIGAGGGVVVAFILWAMVDDPRRLDYFAYPGTLAFYRFFVGVGAALGFFYWLLAGAPKRSNPTPRSKITSRRDPNR